MPKKAGPKRIDPETFLPVVLTPKGTSDSILVCKRRWLRGPDVLGGQPGSIVSKHFTFPVAIQLGEPPMILFHLVDDELVWENALPENFRISNRCAKVALAEAWHAVNAKIDLATLSIHVVSSPIAWSGHKNGVRMRNIYVAMAWDRWNREGLSMSARSDVLATFGIKWTGGQIEKFAVERGLPENSA